VFWNEAAHKSSLESYQRKNKRKEKQEGAKRDFQVVSSLKVESV